MPTLTKMNSTIKTGLEVTVDEKALLRKNKIKLQDLKQYTVADLCSILNTSEARAKEIYALAEFQSIPSIGIKFAHDLISLGFYSLNDLKGKDGAEVFDKLEVITGAWIDPCVEDQCRLVVHYANDRSSNKNWWDFTDERKHYRAANGFPKSRPEKPWFELDKYKTR